MPDTPPLHATASEVILLNKPFGVLCQFGTDDGPPTLRLVRWSVGPWSLHGLTPGGWRRAQVELAPRVPRSR